MLMGPWPRTDLAVTAVRGESIRNRRSYRDNAKEES